MDQMNGAPAASSAWWSMLTPSTWNGQRSGTPCSAL